jgi:hypothetical protein
MKHWDRIPKATWTSPDLRNTSTWQTSSSKTSCKTEKENNIEPKGNPITNFMGHDLAIIVMQNLLFIGSYGIDMNVIHLIVLFEHWSCAHFFDTNVVCLFVLFTHWCYMFIPIIYTQKSCKQFPCLNNAWHSCLNNMNPWNDRFHIDLEWTHGVYKFVMLKNLNVVERATKTMRRDKTGRQIGRGPCNALTGPDNQTHLGMLLWLHSLILSHIF